MEMENKKVFFIGNRVKVLETIFSLRYVVVKIMCLENSFLHKYCVKNNFEFLLIKDKGQVIREISKNSFDLLVSNGCPYILPVSVIKKKNQLFINIHPSLLPDLKGKNPINGAFLYNRDAGATCHYMDDGIDTGEIISQVKIPMSNDLNLGLLYQLSFMAEADAFKEAHIKNFSPDNQYKICSQSNKEYLYYSRKESDMLFSLTENCVDIIRKIKAFGIEGQGAFFIYRNNNFQVMDVQIVTNEYLLKKKNNFQENQVVCIYNNNLLIKKGNAFLNFKGVVGNINLIQENTILSSG